MSKLKITLVTSARGVPGEVRKMALKRATDYLKEKKGDDFSFDLTIAMNSKPHMLLLSEDGRPLLKRKGFDFREGVFSSKNQPILVETSEETGTSKQDVALAFCACEIAIATLRSVASRYGALNIDIVGGNFSQSEIAEIKSKIAAGEIRSQSPNITAIESAREEAFVYVSCDTSFKSRVNALHDKVDSVKRIVCKQFKIKPENVIAGIAPRESPRPRRKVEMPPAQPREALYDDWGDF